jgi:hypothetical protein
MRSPLRIIVTGLIAQNREVWLRSKSVLQMTPLTLIKKPTDPGVQGSSGSVVNDTVEFLASRDRVSN